MRIAVVTSYSRGYASLFVDSITRAPIPGIELVAVVHSSNVSTAPLSRRLRKRAQKTRRIGLFGALNGLRMRRWFGRDLAAELAATEMSELCASRGIPFMTVPRFGDPAAITAFKALDLDLALSLGNSFISPKFFSVPRMGMINVHHEWLPDYRGAQPVLWQVHNGSPRTGYSIHVVTEHIDGGRILYRESLPILWSSSLHRTVVLTTAEVQRRSVEGIRIVLEQLQAGRVSEIENEGGRDYTTPSIAAMFRIYRNYRRLRRAAVCQ